MASHFRTLAGALVLSIVLSTMPTNISIAQAVEPLGDPILFWNEIAIQAGADDHSGTFGAPQQMGPGRTSRALAIIHAAMYDAVNSIDPTHEPYLTLVPIPQGEEASVHAAVAIAAHATLVNLYSAQQASFQSKLEDYLALIPDGPEKTLGQAIGNTVANAILLARSTDHAGDPETFTPSDQPGRHRKDPLNPGQPYLGPQWGAVTPFSMDTPAQFRAPTPPALDRHCRVCNGLQ